MKYRFLGHLAHEDILKFYNNNYIDVFINISKFEGVPVSIMEACSFKVPIIATNVGAVSEIVIDKYNGVLLSPDPTTSEIVEAIDFFYYFPEVTKSYRENAYAIWKKQYNAQINYNKLIDDIYKLEF